MRRSAQLFLLRNKNTVPREAGLCHQDDTLLRLTASCAAFNSLLCRKTVYRQISFARTRCTCLLFWWHRRPRRWCAVWRRLFASQKNTVPREAGLCHQDMGTFLRKEPSRARPGSLLCRKTVYRQISVASSRCACLLLWWHRRPRRWCAVWRILFASQKNTVPREAGLCHQDGTLFRLTASRTASNSLLYRKIKTIRGFEPSCRALPKR